MTPVQTTKMSNFRWVICALLFLATTVNYMDRQVLSLTWKDFIAADFHWTDADYGFITGMFSLFYAIANIFAGKFIDWMGTKKGYLIAIFVWSTGAVLHAGCGWVTMNIEGYPNIEALRLVQAGSDAAVAIATISVWLFLSCRLIHQGYGGVFPCQGSCVLHLYLQQWRICGCTRCTCHDSPAGSCVGLGDGFHHHRCAGLCVDGPVALAV